MKKLMIALASAATAVFAFGEDVLSHGADFENANYTAGENFTNYVNKADDGAATSGNRYWYSTSEDIGVISNHQSGISVKSVPDLYENATPTGGVKYLQLDTQTRLFRTIANNDQSGSFTGVDMSTGDGVYLDTLVKFTAADAAFGTDALEEADKIAIEYVEREIEYGTGDEATVVKVTPLTNFVVRAGFIGSAFATNYLVDVPDGWLENNMKDDWHRLTVRALTNIDGNNRAGFKIYLDEEPLVYRTDKDEFAQSAGFEDDTHMIFPSAVASGVNKTTISAVAFSGNGSIDDVVFTTTKPKFIAESEAVVVPFVADAGVTAITVTVAGVTDPISVVDGEATLPAQTTDFTVNVTVDEANGYTLGGISYGGTPVVDGEVTGYAGGDITITTIRNNFNLFDEKGDPIQGTFQTLSEAFAAEGVAMIKLAYDYDALAFEGEDFDGYDIDGEIVLDLNGNDLDGGDDSAGASLFRVIDVGVLTIIDSVGGGSISYDTQYGYAIVNNDGSDAFIGAATGDAGATFNGKLFEDGYEGYIIKGYIDDANNADEGEFLWGSCLDSGSAYELVDNYWVVEPQSTPEPVIPTYVLTIPEVTGASAEVTSNDVVVADLTAIPSNTAVVVTWTLSEGYKLTAGSLTETITMDSNKEAATPTVAKIQYVTLTITPVDNCTIVVSNATEEVATGATFDVDDSVELIVYRTPADGYELDNCAATETITMNADRTVTAAVKQSGGSYPSYIDEITDPEKKAAYEAKYNTWATYAGVDVATGEVNEDAFLLNCKPAEVAAAKAAFKFTSISYDATQQKWVATTTTSYNEREFNGTVTVKQYSDVGCTTESETGTFFKAVLQ